MRRWMSTVVICAALAACDDNTDLNLAPHDSGAPEASTDGGAKDATADASDASTD